MALSGRKRAKKLVAQFKLLYENLNYEHLNDENSGGPLIDQVYRHDLVFRDSFHHIQGREEFRQYCLSLYENLKSCHFDFHRSWINEGDAMLTWTMHYSHPRLRGGKVITVEGASEIRFEEKIYHHQDYFDGGNLLYEHVPILGSVIAQLKKRMSA